MMHYIGPAYRPPFEEKSLLLQVSTGCNHNKCAFCSMYKGVKFTPSPMEDIESDVRFIGRNRTLFKRAFLVGGDPFALPYKRLKRIGKLIGEHIPRIESIGCYASIPNVLAKTPEQLNELAQLGYANLNIGLETGLDDVLATMRKGYTADEAREALSRLNEAGIPFTLNLVHGLAGSGRSLENALASAELVNEARPALVIVTALHVDEATELSEWVDSGQFKLPSLQEVIEEEAAFLRATELSDTIFFGMHETLPVRVNGHLPKDRDFLASEVEAALQRFPGQQLAAPMRRRKPITRA
ncbi:MAG: radical SAM protein [Eggerthellaceae bacterium]|nr:radical SAM protein [Eggerthellaceae bacterium]